MTFVIVLLIWWLPAFIPMLLILRSTGDVTVGDVLLFGTLSMMLGTFMVIALLFDWLEPAGRRLMKKKLISKKKGTP